MRMAPTLLLALTVSPLSAQDEFAWYEDLEAARGMAAEAGKPLLAMFRCER